MTEQLVDTNSTAGAETAPIQVLTGKRANWTIAHTVNTIKGLDGQSDDREIVWTVKGAGTLRLLMGALSEQNRSRAAEHGMIQRISDAAAMARDKKTGASATPQEKYEAMKWLVEHYEGGGVEWSPQREKAKERAPRVNAQEELLVAALLLHAPGKSRETVEQFVKGLKAQQVTGLVVSTELKEAVELAREQLREQEARAAEGVDAVELLKGL